MVGIVAALYDEVYSIVHLLKYTKIEGIPQYTGKINGISVSLYLTKPGLQKISKFQKWQTQHSFRSFINAGFAGALTDNFKHGDAVIAKKVISNKTEKFYLKTEKLDKIFKPKTLYTTDKPVFSFEDKEDIYYLSKADIVDMEAHKILKASDDIGTKTDKWHILKIIGDLPGDETFLEKEVSFRDFFTSKSFSKKLNIIKNTGLKTSWLLYKRKKFLQETLYNSLFKLIGSLD
ncbi:MAG: hypothetical protein OEZ13_05880 [Spirochaetia bacterium]|nr:hypothetical protein [Spirochaetia bacterium]